MQCPVICTRGAEGSSRLDANMEDDDTVVQANPSPEAFRSRLAKAAEGSGAARTREVMGIVEQAVSPSRDVKGKQREQSVPQVQTPTRSARGDRPERGYFRDLINPTPRRPLPSVGPTTMARIEPSPGSRGSGPSRLRRMTWRSITSTSNSPEK